ncbi:hypothetical protein NE237_022702 [Protea cynaroides]|uniref:Uncharacterized protein n=1 Tax=Protea cynaroides TaxID=273540 RepID=A0A9Q0K623_9MAGN|nr:hypothetical protein NE237_022702 [Protea cynaroides]
MKALAAVDQLQYRPFYLANNIILITVSDKVITSTDNNLMLQLLPAMQNLQNALNSVSLGGKIKVSTVHSMGNLSQSDPPSSGMISPAYTSTLNGLLGFSMLPVFPSPLIHTLSLPIKAIPG